MSRHKETIYKLIGEVKSDAVDATDDLPKHFKAMLSDSEDSINSVVFDEFENMSVEAQLVACIYAKHVASTNMEETK